MEVKNTELVNNILNYFSNKFKNPIYIKQHDLRNQVVLKYYNFVKNVNKFDIMFVILNNKYVVTNAGLNETLDDLRIKLENQYGEKIDDVKILAIEDENDENSFVWIEWLKICN